MMAGPPLFKRAIVQTGEARAMLHPALSQELEEAIDKRCSPTAAPISLMPNGSSSHLILRVHTICMWRSFSLTLQRNCCHHKHYSFTMVNALNCVGLLRSDKQEDKQRQLLRTISDSPSRPLPPIRRNEEAHLPVSSGPLEAAGAGMV